MDVSTPVWIATIAFIVALLAFDFVFHVRKAHVPTLAEAARWSAIYVGIALLFGVGVWVLGGHTMGAEYFAGYVTEKALSVDNLFVFLIIMQSFKVPRADQQKVLLFGIVFSLIARTGFHPARRRADQLLRLGVLLFGLILLITADNLLKPENSESKSADILIVRLPRKLLHTSEHYDGDKLFNRERPTGPDPDAAGHRGRRRHRHSVRARLHPGELRADPKRLPGVHRHRVLPARPAPVVLPHRRPAGPAYHGAYLGYGGPEGRAAVTACCARLLTAQWRARQWRARQGSNLRPLGCKTSPPRTPQPRPAPTVRPAVPSGTWSTPVAVISCHRPCHRKIIEVGIRRHPARRVVPVG